MFLALANRRPLLVTALPLLSAASLFVEALTGCGSDSTTTQDDGHDHEH